MPLAYDTLLDLAQQRLAFIAASPNWTRAARHDALKMQRDVADELAAFNRRTPCRLLVPTAVGESLLLCQRIAA